MNPRFPDVSVVLMGLPKYDNPNTVWAAQSGAFRGIYDIARKEYEILRGLATAALSGHPDALDDLKSYLDVQASIADLYAKNLEQSGELPENTQSLQDQ